MSIDELDELDNIFEEIEEESKYVEPYVNNLVNKCCNKLDDYIGYVAKLMNDPNYNLTDTQLDDIIMTIPLHIYFVGTQQEMLGIKQDVSESNRKLLYNKIYSETAGAAGVKKAVAETESFNESLVTTIYERAYNIIKSKVTYATEILQSAKKVVSRRMTETELSRMAPNIIKEKRQ